MKQLVVVVVSVIAAQPAAACPTGADYFSFGGGSSAPIPRLKDGEHGGRVREAIGLSPSFILMGVDGDRLQAWGVGLEARVQREQLSAVADAGIYNAIEAEPGRRGKPGTLARTSGAVRWEPVALRMDASAVVAPFFELGVGLERWTFAAGPTRHRPDATLGLGMHVHGGSMDSRKTRHVGATLVTRLIAAPGDSPVDGAVARSVVAKPDRRTELGVEVGLAVTWGRRGHP